MPSIAPFTAVYGPVVSWRYGRSLGIDPIGPVSSCSFNCVYCQLGEIEQPGGDRRVFVPTEQILQELEDYRPWPVDVITFSGSGEPTLAANLGELLQAIKTLTDCPTLVLTNAVTLGAGPDPLQAHQVREELAWADKVSVKWDALDGDHLQRINRPISGVTPETLWQGIRAFAADYPGELSVQTMVMAPWSDTLLNDYLDRLCQLRPHAVQLNTPTRPKPRQRSLDGRGNHTPPSPGDRTIVRFKCVSPTVLQTLAERIRAATGIPTYCAPSPGIA